MARDPDRSSCPNGAWRCRRACSPPGTSTRAQEITKGQEIADIETSKIANAFESPVAGPLRRRLVGEGETVPVGALLARRGRAVGPGRRDRRLRRRVPGELRRASAAEAAAKRRRSPRSSRPAAGACAISSSARRDGRAGHLHPRLRRRPQQLAVQPAGPGREPHHLRARPAGPWRLDQGGRAPATSARWPRPSATSWTAMDIAKAHLVGHSLGGAVSLDLALEPSRPGGLGHRCRPAGLGPEISMEYIDGFIEHEPRREAEAGARDAGRRSRRW